MAVNEMVVGNLNCVFIGQKAKYDLLDFWSDFASSVFQSGIKIGRKTKFILYECKWVMLNDKEPCIIGRFVKDTDLEINQVIDANTLVPKKEVHPSAPSSIFVFLLKSHTILYVGEYKGYPDVRSFRRFVEISLNNERRKHIESLIENKEEAERIKIIEKYPQAHVSFVPFPSGKTLTQELASVEKISSITIKQYLQNGAFNPGSFSKSNEALMKQVGTAKISVSITSPQNIEGAKQAVTEIATQSESELTIDATTARGKKTITNEGLQYRKKLGATLNNKKLDEAAKKILEIFQEEIQASELPTPSIRNLPAKLKKVKYE